MNLPLSPTHLSSNTESIDPPPADPCFNIPGTKALDLNISPDYDSTKGKAPVTSSALYKRHAPASLTLNMVKEKMKLFSPPADPKKAMEAATLMLPEEP